ncbi:MAG TPA: hypothetical protein VGN72_01265 [Tepidisphaeraceae bacterium]|jgi:site-specific DNA-adenine methylase|nr:hypothetical protein [Tepidisphaeraceae bacterium]
MSNEMKVTAVANWFGGNRMLAHRVGQELAGCALVAVPFAGGMSELPHIGAAKILVNDLHRHVINLARVMADRTLGPQLYRALRRKAFTQDELDAAQVGCKSMERASEPGAMLFGGNEAPPANDDGPCLKWAEDYAVATWMNRGGKSGTRSEFTGALPIRYSPNGGGSAQRFQNWVASIPQWRNVLRRCEFTTQDAFDFLARQHDSPRLGVYLDPPWPKAGKVYTHAVDDRKFHARIVERLSQFKQSRVVVRYGDHPLIRELYPQSRWTWLELGGRDQANDEAADVLILNGPSLAKTAA